MRKLLALGLMIATSIAVAAWARPSSVLTPVTGRFTSVDATAGSFTVDTPTARLTFTTDGRTIFLQGVRRVELVDLQIDDQVKVTYRARGAEKTAAHVETVPPGTVAGQAVTGRVAFVDVPGRRVTIDASSLPSDLNAISAGDEVRIVPASDPRTADRIDILSGEARIDGAVSTHRTDPVESGSRRRVLGAWLLAMAGTAVVLRARRHRTI